MTPLAVCRLSWFALAIAGVSLPAAALDLDDLPVGTVQNFGPNLQTAAAGVCRQPEGLAIDPNGNLYAASNSDTATAFGYVCVINKHGSLVDIISVAAAPGAAAVGLLGELWEDGSLYVLDQADNIPPHGRILKIDPRTHQVKTVADGFAFPNGMAEDRRGNIYFTDSFLGTIFKLSKDDAKVTPWFKDPTLLSQNPDQPVGANDLAFDANEHFLYVDNAGNRQVLRIPVGENGHPGKIQLFADGATIDNELHLNGPVALFFADGMQFDVEGNLYVMANITNEVEVFSPHGKLIHRYSGTGNNALDFNASAVFKGRLLFMTNMSATDGGVNSKLSVLVTPFRGLRLQ
ncbi:MAG TPA: SMP-30/gluconolactonase/LRE family protein [Xanthobacteraceae bacterium]|nr:SMP-30/gluconolactonase/LRE family protein [Xanthobacteraceae bacterium]